MVTIAGTIIVFTILIVALSGLILTAENFLVQKGKVRILVNDDVDKALEVESGSTLLSTLSSEGILLPSACGGQGTCGVCKCKVHEGGGDLLPTETTFISRKMARDGYRLACQVKVRQDMRIEVPEEVFSIKKWECDVISNKNVATYIKEFVVRLPRGEVIDFQPGGYIQIEAPGVEVDFSTDIDIPDMFREEWQAIGCFDLKVKSSDHVMRAYSMANHPAEGNMVMLNVRIATPPWDSAHSRFKKVSPGLMSSYIFSKRPGDKVTISGPYGEFFIQDTDREMIYIGGGAGMAPMRSHIFHLFETLKTGRKVSFFYGARSKREIFYESHFKKIAKKFPNFKFYIALSDPHPDDKWKGLTGFIHQVVYDEYLKDHPAPEDIEYYLCGPPVMTDAVEAMLDSLGVEPEMIRFDKF